MQILVSQPSKYFRADWNVKEWWKKKKKIWYVQEKKIILNCQKYSFWFCPVLLEKKEKEKLY